MHEYNRVRQFDPNELGNRLMRLSEWCETIVELISLCIFSYNLFMGVIGPIWLKACIEEIARLFGLLAFSYIARLYLEYYPDQQEDLLQLLQVDEEAPLPDVQALQIFFDNGYVTWQPIPDNPSTKLISDSGGDRMCPIGGVPALLLLALHLNEERAVVHYVNPRLLFEFWLTTSRLTVRNNGTEVRFKSRERFDCPTCNSPLSEGERMNVLSYVRFFNGDGSRDDSVALPADFVGDDVSRLRIV